MRYLMLIVWIAAVIFFIAGILIAAAVALDPEPTGILPGVEVDR